MAAEPAERLHPPAIEHPLGTDQLGRDLLARLLHGARWTLGFAALATGGMATLGTFLGMVAGYRGGLWDWLVMRMADVVLALPGLLLALALIGIWGTGIEKAVLALVAVGWADYARIVRGLTLVLRERDFVAAAQALGAGEGWIVLHHILPGVLPTVVVVATLEMGQVVLAFAGLGFLGLGVPPPTPEWGSMVSEARSYLFTAPHLVIFPSLAILFAALGFNLLGDGLRDVLDPRRT